MGVLSNTTMMLSQISFWLDGSLPALLGDGAQLDGGRVVGHQDDSPVVLVLITEMQCIALAYVN